MQAKFFGRNALWGVFCTLLTGLIFVVASCDSGSNSGGESSGSTRSSSSYEKPVDIPSTNLSITDTTFRWVSDEQDEAHITVGARLTTDDPAVTGFDSVLVKLNGKVLNKGGQGQTSFSYNRNGIRDDYINVETELGPVAPGAGICGADITLVVEVYISGKKDPEARASKTIKKAADSGNCKSSSSTEPSSSSVFQIKPLVSVGKISLKNGEGVNVSTAGSGSDITVSITTSGGRETILTAGSSYHMTDQFWRGDPENPTNCGTRGYSYNQASPNYVGGAFNTEKFYPCLGAAMESSFDCRNTFKLVKAKSSEATDWAQDWYLLYCIEEGSGTGSSAEIEIWKVN